MIIIADSGSTSVSWKFWRNADAVLSLKTEGANPVYQTEEELEKLFSKAAAAAGPGAEAVFFYGAGILSEETAVKVKSALRSAFGCSQVQAESDLLAAARAVCGRRPGIAAILGTGSNSCLYDGTSITEHVNAGGFILGDEGSGAVLGRTLVSDFIKGRLPEELRLILSEEYALDYSSVVQKVYREAMPSRYLARFTYFLKQHEEHPYVEDLLHRNLILFFERNILPYGRKDLPVGFIGSVAEVFRHQLLSAARCCGVQVGSIFPDAVEGLLEYHMEGYGNE